MALARAPRGAATAARASSRSASAARSSTVRVCAAKQESQGSALLAFGVAALLNVAPANAGVILEQPTIKKVLQDTAPSAPAPKREIILPGMRKSAPATKAAAAKPKAAPRVQETSAGDLDPRAIALPGTLALIAGGAFALTKVDEGFEDFMTSASCKDSSQIGAGYETDLKNGALAVKGKAPSRTGTKKVKAATKSGGGGSPLSSFFGN